LLISLTLFFLSSEANAFPSSLISMLHMFTYNCVCLCATTMSRILFWLAKRQMIFLFYLSVVSIFWESKAHYWEGGSSTVCHEIFRLKICFCIGREIELED
jgi:hypothetical protein